jgi:hypothetical protein
MSRVARENGYVEDSELNGNTVVTVTIEGIQATNDDMLDRILQFVMIEMGIDVSWATVAPEQQEVPPPPPLQTGEVIQPQEV